MTFVCSNIFMIWSSRFLNRLSCNTFLIATSYKAEIRCSWYGQRVRDQSLHLMRLLNCRLVDHTKRAISNDLLRFKDPFQGVVRAAFPICGENKLGIEGRNQEIDVVSKIHKPATDTDSRDLVIPVEVLAVCFIFLLFFCCKT